MTWHWADQVWQRALMEKSQLLPRLLIHFVSDDAVLEGRSFVLRRPEYFWAHCPVIITERAISESDRSGLSSVPSCSRDSLRQTEPRFLFLAKHGLRQGQPGD
jgi:hypothetical protein